MNRCRVRGEIKLRIGGDHRICSARVAKGAVAIARAQREIALFDAVALSHQVQATALDT